MIYEDHLMYNIRVGMMSRFFKKWGKIFVYFNSRLRWGMCLNNDVMATFILKYNAKDKRKILL